jgi:hypothetical protein
MNPYGFALADLQTLGYTSEEFIDFYIKSLDYIIELNQRNISILESAAMSYLYKILTSYDANNMDERSPCGACI